MALVKTKEDLRALLRDAAMPDIAELIDERMAKALEESKAQQEKDFARMLAGANNNQQVANTDKQVSPQRRAAQTILAAAKAGPRAKASDAADVASKMGYETVAKALGESTGAGGGFLLQPEQGEYIESLTAGAAVRQLGPRVIPMPSGSITLPAGDGSATAYWSAESTNVSSSEPSARQVNMSAKRLTVIVPLSNELLRDSGGMAEAWVEDEAKKAATEAEDLAFIRGDGDENAPRGMLYRATSGNKFDITHAAASATSDEIYVDLGKAIRKLADNDIPMIRPGWVMSKRSEWKIRTLLNDLAIPIFKSEMDGGRLFGFPFASTTQIPNNLDTSSDGDDDESEIYFADFYSVVIGQTGGVEMSVHDAASYYNGSSVVSGLSRYETVVRLVYRVDFSSLHEGKDIAVIQSVDWA